MFFNEAAELASHVLLVSYSSREVFLSVLSRVRVCMHAALPDNTRPLDEIQNDVDALFSMNPSGSNDSTPRDELGPANGPFVANGLLTPQERKPSRTEDHKDLGAHFAGHSSGERLFGTLRTSGRPPRPPDRGIVIPIPPGTPNGYPPHLHHADHTFPTLHPDHGDHSSQNGYTPHPDRTRSVPDLLSSGVRSLSISAAGAAGFSGAAVAATSTLNRRKKNGLMKPGVPVFIRDISSSTITLPGRKFMAVWCCKLVI